MYYWLSHLLLFSLTSALAQPQPLQSFFGYERIAPPMLSKPAPQLIPQPQP